MDMTEEEKQAAEEKAKADAEAAAAAETAKQNDPEYWKSEAKKAFEARDRAKEEARQLQERMQQPPPVVTPPPVEEDLNELYWKEPAKVMEKLIGKYVEPFVEDRYELQKGKYAADPEFRKYAPKIDEMVKMQPQLKQQPGIVDKLYKVVRAMEFDPEAERQRIRQEEVAKLQTKQGSLVEGAGSPGAGPAPTPTIDLTDDEKKTAEKFNPGINPQEAHKKYAEKKAKWLQGAY